MEEKLKYEPAKTDLILFDNCDVISTSDPLGDSGPNFDKDAWA